MTVKSTQSAIPVTLDGAVSRGGCQARLPLGEYQSANVSALIPAGRGETRDDL